METAMFTRFRAVTKLGYGDGNFEVRTLVCALDTETENIFKTFDFTVEQNDYYVTVIEKCDAYFIPKRNTIHERACFHQRQQKPR